MQYSARKYVRKNTDLLRLKRCNNLMSVKYETQKKTVDPLQSFNPVL